MGALDAKVMIEEGLGHREWKPSPAGNCGRAIWSQPPAAFARVVTTDRGR